jgi:hemoglobin-like flavoprotein
MATTQDRAVLVRESLERLAEARGDITAEVLERYYAAQPDARQSFERHGLADMAGLEARMVAESVFLLLRWVEEPSAARIDQATTIVHHNDTLDIGPRWYMGLIDAVLDILLEAAQDTPKELEMWQTIRTEIARFIDSLRPEFLHTIDPQPLIGET